MITFEDIEQGMLRTVRSEVPEFASVAPYSGEFEQEVGRLPVRYPSAWVLYGGSQYTRVDRVTWRQQVRMNVIVAARQLRGERRDVGAYELLRRVVAALTGRTFGLDVETLSPVSTELLMSEGGVTLYSVEFQSAFDMTHEPQE